MIVYRKGEDEFVALVMGDVESKDDVLTRVHSECLTGEVFGSLRCDCRSQLELAFERITAAGFGLLVYLRQEGRGIGLGNKIRAYALQDEGADTVDANLSLGFDADSRSYEQAAAIIEELRIRSVRLMTNNPDKVASLQAAGINIVAQESHWGESSEHNAAYLSAKKMRMGHIHDTGLGQGAGDSQQPASADFSPKKASSQ